MSKVCEVTGKRPISGHSVSHSNAKTKRRFVPNLHKKRFYIPETNQWVTLKVSAHALRTINKKGIYAFLKEQQYNGIELPFELKEPKADWWVNEE